MIKLYNRGRYLYSKYDPSIYDYSKKHPFNVFTTLRKNNPSPFGGYFNYGDFQIISASPERFLKLTDKKIETRPIKGTIKRGSSPKEDAVLKKELINSEKDKSELLMIVDLERNDLNRTCIPGSVKVPENFAIEEYATVYHLVSTVVGELKKENDITDLLKTAFPGGSITGTPKIRAMEIIDELERCPRAIYTGSLGYIGFDGNCDFNIIIRTLLHKEGTYHLGVGGGITCESNPESEYKETLQKAKALFNALECEHHEQ
jgi:para-aminobenzoate synthetase component 1